MQINVISQNSFKGLWRPGGGNRISSCTYLHVNPQRQKTNQEIMLLLKKKFERLESNFSPNNLKQLHNVHDFAKLLSWTIEQKISRTISKDELKNNPELYSYVREIKAKTIQKIVKNAEGLF